jgi:hypothetical protein
MVSKVKFEFRKVCSGLLIAWFAFCGNAFAATLVSYDLTGGGTEVGNGDGNHFEFITPVFAVDSLEVWAYSDEGIGNTSLLPAQVVDYAGVAGLGVCNSQEDTYKGNGLINKTCEQQNQNVQSADNTNEQDWLLFIIPNTPDNEWVSVTLQAQGVQTPDISYWIGNLDSAPASFTYAGLGGAGAFTHVDGVVQGDPLLINLGNMEGNALLIGASLTNLDGIPDRPFVSGITTLVPLPPAVLMFGSALLALFAKRRVKV